MTKRIGLFLFPPFLFMVAFSSIVCAKEYTLEECKKTIENITIKVLEDLSSIASTNIKIELSKENPRSFTISAQTIPGAYLVDGKYIAPEVQKIFDSTPVQMLATVQCPLNMDNAEEEKQYKESLLNAMKMVDTYSKQQITTSTFKDFMRQVVGFYSVSKDNFAREAGKPLPVGYSMNVLWGAQERFTDYSFQNLYIMLDYCAYFIDNKHDSSDQIEQKRQNCLRKQSRRFEFTIQIEGRTEEEISKELAIRVKQLNTMMFVYFRALIARENKQTI
ncbi:MAG: hypothetical protein AAB795_04340 [Patescibacteria group bacterium]